MKYIRLFWPSYQDYMECEVFYEVCIYDCLGDSYFIPENWLEKLYIEKAYETL